MTNQKKDGPAFLLQKFGKNEWKFVYPETLQPLISQFNKAVQDLDLDHADQALKLFNALKKQLPEYIDVYNIIGLIHLWRKEYTQALDVLESGMTKISKLFPEDFFNKQPLVEWSIEANRPFLSCVTKLGIALNYTQNYIDAIEIFEQLMMMNPKDHQAVRNVLLWTYLKEEWIDAAYELCVFYKDDMLPALSYGYGLILYRQNKLEQATLQLSAACEFYPAIAKALIKLKKHSSNEDYLLLFEKPDDAAVYVQHYGIFWQQTEGALALLKNIFAEQ